MMTERSGARDGWQALREGDSRPAGGQVPVRSLGVSTASGMVRVALSGAGLPRLLLPVESSAEPMESGVADALGLVSVSLVTDAGPGHFIDFSCNEAALESVFADVCDAVAGRIAGGESTTSALRRTLAEFAALFRTSPAAQTDQRVLRGLLGELLYLDTLVDQNPRSVRLWRGADGERHDFAGSVNAVEIKTIARPEAPVTIGSFDQLLAPEGGTLHLRVYELHEASGAPLSVAALVDSIVSRCSDPTRFLEQVGQLGYTGDPATPWSALRFDPGTVREWTVDHRFPAITRDALAPRNVAGLLGVSYTIRPEDVPACECDPQAQLAMQQRLIDAIGTLP